MPSRTFRKRSAKKARRVEPLALFAQMRRYTLAVLQAAETAAETKGKPGPIVAGKRK
jgi:hypothetical protein